MYYRASRKITSSEIRERIRCLHWYIQVGTISCKRKIIKISIRTFFHLPSHNLLIFITYRAPPLCIPTKVETTREHASSTVLYLVVQCQSKSKISPGTKLSPRFSFWPLSKWPSGDRFLPVKRFPKFRKSESHGLSACVGSEKRSLSGRTGRNYSQRFLLEAKSCPCRRSPLTVGAIVAATAP